MNDMFFEHLKTVDSTNLELKRRLIAGGVSGFCCIRADEQTAGRGRRGRTWLNTDGALMMSVSVPLEGFSERETMLLSMSSAYAVQKALSAFGLNALIKWPNDVAVLCGGCLYKLCGILTELIGDARGNNYAVIGIGINANSIDLPDGLMQPATSVRLETGADIDLDTLQNAVLDCLIKTLERLNARPDEVFEELRKNCHTINRPVMVKHIDGTCTQGFATDLAPDGRLTVKTEDGEITVSAADVSVRTDS